MVDRNGTSETLAPVGAAIGQLEVMHGGKFVNYLSPQGDQYLGWDAGSRTWRSATPPVNWLDELRSGTLLSMFGRSHDQDSASVVDISTVMGTDWFRTKDSEVAPVMAGAVDGPFQEVGRVTVHNLPSPLESNCLHRNPISGFCFFTLTETRGWLFRHSYPQFPTEHGREGYVTVSPMQVVALEFTEWTPCSFEPLHECRRQKSIQEQVEALVYRLDLTGRNATPNLITTIPGETVYWIGQAESSQDAVLGRGRWRMTHWADAGRFYATGDPFFDFQEELERCVIEYRREEDFGAVGSPIPADGACYWDSFNFPTSSSGTGTIAPSSVLDPSGWEVMEVDGRIEVRLPVVKPAFR